MYNIGSLNSSFEEGDGELILKLSEEKAGEEMTMQTFNLKNLDNVAQPPNIYIRDGYVPAPPPKANINTLPPIDGITYDQSKYNGQRPWLNPGAADISNWFNLGLNEEQWKLYINKHVRK